MSVATSQYLGEIQKQLSTGHAQEHSYRPALEALFKSATQLHVVNEPKGSQHGRPDFIFLNKEVPIAWVEAKDLYVSLEKIEKSEQMGRYYGYPNLILTNGLEFRFYKNGQKYGEPIEVASKKGDALELHTAKFKYLEQTLAEFVADPVDTIRSAQHLAKIMGGKARRLRDNLREMLTPEFKGTKGDIEKIRDILKAKLIHDLTNENFADLYAQTLVYGLFVARYNDDSSESFSRAEAREKIPASNHLLQQFFDHIAGVNFEKKLSYIVDELCDVFVHADVHALVHGLYQKGDDETHDPIIHFYEDFLREYDPKLRMDRGVFYTPLPVVRFIVRSVDALLKEHFGLSQGLADRAQIEWNFTEQGKTSKRSIDRVQILDPAVGTGTFLNEVIRTIHERYKDRAGEWEAYANEHLIPRLHGFELMMASYTIAHLKLAMTLAETGVKKIKNRLKIFLTNSLEEAPAKDDTLFRGLGLDGALTEEAWAAEEVKRDLPIMVVLGNPPYSVSSQNASIAVGSDGKKRKTWIGKLLDDYKKDLNEKSFNSLSDDYVKFIRFAHHLIEKNGQGIVAMITNNSFLDGITHRRMRQHLLETFDHIYVVDLHGSSKRKEKAPNGGKDENVFDIMQGVGITLLVKTGAKNNLGKVHHVDVYGERESKYSWLNSFDTSNTKWENLDVPEPNFFFVPKDFSGESEYLNGLRINELFPLNSAGIKTHRDDFAIAFNLQETKSRLLDFLSTTISDDEIANKYELKNTNSWALSNARKKQRLENHQDIIQRIYYRPFDVRYCMYSDKIMDRPRSEVMNHMLLGKNIALISTRMLKGENFGHALVTDCVQEMISLSPKTSNTAYHFPLHLYSIGNKQSQANLNLNLLDPMLQKLGLAMKESGSLVTEIAKVRGKEGDDGSLIGTACSPEDIFDYIYAILHSPTYRERYKEFLKIDFPRIPFTSNKDLFSFLLTLGREIRLLHLMQSSLLNKFITKYPIAGDNVVEKVVYDAEKLRVHINPTQYFEGVTEAAWNSPIGGYQPLQKWLKDRKGRTLSSDDLEHYQKIVVALVETKRLMEQIDKAIAENGGWPMK